MQVTPPLSRKPRQAEADSQNIGKPPSSAESGRVPTSVSQPAGTLFFISSHSLVYSLVPTHEKKMVARLVVVFSVLIVMAGRPPQGTERCRSRRLATSPWGEQVVTIQREMGKNMKVDDTSTSLVPTYTSTENFAHLCIGARFEATEVGQNAKEVPD